MHQNYMMSFSTTVKFSLFCKKEIPVKFKKFEKEKRNEKVNDVVVIVVCFCFVGVRG